MNLPDIGATMYSVHEHYYYESGRAAPLKEYCVCEGTVQRYCYGHYTEICVVGKIPDKGPTPSFYKTTEIGKRVFYTEPEAIQYAERLTDEHERKWKWADGKLRRPWRKEKGDGESEADKAGKSEEPAL